MSSDNKNFQQQVRHIGHEIRNNLSICDIYSEIIKKHLIKDNIQNPNIENALNCIQNSIKLINNNLLDLKSLGNITQHICEADKLIEQAVSMSKVYIQDKSIEIIDKINSNEKIYIDENKFLSCLINILKNAIESIEKQGLIKVETGIKNNKLIISISNNGIPIPKEDIKNLFNDGFTTKTNGSGIGLYLCKKYLNEQNSDISLKCSDESQTVFEIITDIVR